ncbi:hypothetical protein [Photobacterium profundum]|uniref:hypothetical protein n=1 Tax=Photobacterium profundum TaxID=74109 RepID=UPI003D110C52
MQSNFTLVPNQFINDSLSWAAKGMLLYLCSKPEDWEVNINDLVNHTKNTKKKSGRDAVYKIMHELIGANYMRRTQLNNNGAFGKVDYEVCFTPFQDTADEKPLTVNPDTVPLPEKPLPDNPLQQSKERTKKRLDQDPIVDNLEKSTKLPILEKYYAPERPIEPTGTKPKHFVIPTVEEIYTHMRARGGGNMNEAFKIWNFYESKGWMVGRNKMKNWKAAVTNWMVRNENDAGNVQQVHSKRILSPAEEFKSRMRSKGRDVW